MVLSSADVKIWKPGSICPDWGMEASAEGRAIIPSSVIHGTGVALRAWHGDDS